MSVGFSSPSSIDSSLLPRLEAAVLTLRHRFEQHLRQEHRLNSYYLGLQDSWQSHVQHMNSHLTVLEGLLASWVPGSATAPQLSVVTGAEGE